MVDIISGLSDKEAVSQELKRYFEEKVEYNGILYIGYPIIGSREGGYPLDAIWISEQCGIVIFDLVESTDITQYKERQDDQANKLESKLRSYSELMNRRDLCVKVHTITFAPRYYLDEVDDSYPVCRNFEDLDKYINQFDGMKEEYYKKVVSVIQSISTIRTSPKK